MSTMNPLIDAFTAAAQAQGASQVIQATECFVKGLKV